jgi:hypothetical protein
MQRLVRNDPEQPGVGVDRECALGKEPGTPLILSNHVLTSRSLIGPTKELLVQTTEWVVLAACMRPNRPPFAQQSDQQPTKHTPRTAKGDHLQVVISCGTT